MTITLYNRDYHWKVARSFAALIEPTPGALKHYQPQFHYFLLDESQLTEAELPLFNLVSALIALKLTD